MTRNIIIESLSNKPIKFQPTELVERKGVGHPDSICDGIMEEVSVALCREYKRIAGRILHHNIDKSLLVAGITQPKIGGGKILEPMKMYFGDRATNEFKGQKIPVEEIAIETAKQWIRQNLRFVDPVKNIHYISEIKPGSPELTYIFARKKIGANDTSAAVGYAPLSETERIVLGVEHFLNSREFKERFPEVGEDIKVMGYRLHQKLILTVAMAFVDRFIPDQKFYFDRKEVIKKAILDFVAQEKVDLEEIQVDINTLDDPSRGEAGMYLTVTGTSAEGADCGQVGRGNKVNGLIALNRPMGTEAAAGKNPVSHVGKIYNFLTHHIAAHVYNALPGLEEVYVWLCSQIGKPIDEPLIASVQVILKPHVHLKEIAPKIQKVVDFELSQIYKFTERLAEGEFPAW